MCRGCGVRKAFPHRSSARKNQNQHMNTQLSLSSNRKEAEVCKCIHVLARGNSVSNYPCLPKDLAFTSSYIGVVFWSWRNVLKFWGKPLPMKFFSVSSVSLVFISNTLLLLVTSKYSYTSFWNIQVRSFVHSSFSMMHFPIWYYALLYCAYHAIIRFLFHPLGCRVHTPGSPNRTLSIVPEPLVLERQ